jgi:hypothetical protein
MRISSQKATNKKGAKDPSELLQGAKLLNSFKNTKEKYKKLTLLNIMSAKNYKTNTEFAIFRTSLIAN